MLLESAFVGLLLGVFAWITVGTVQRWPIAVKLWRDIAPDMPFLGTATLSLLLGISLPYISNWVLRKTRLQTIEDAQLRAVSRYGNNLQRLLHSAAFDEKTISITLDSRKVYVGYVIQAPNLEPHDTFVAVLPLFSGYRDKDTLELIFTTDYTLVCEKADRPASDFVQVVPISSIRSAGLFDLNVQPLFVSGDDGSLEEVPVIPPDGVNEVSRDTDQSDGDTAPTTKPA